MIKDHSKLLYIFTGTHIFKNNTVQKEEPSEFWKPHGRATSDIR